VCVIGRTLWGADVRKWRSLFGSAVCMSARLPRLEMSTRSVYTTCTERPSAYIPSSWPKKRDHITPVLARLHWLPVAARIQFRIALLTFKTLTTPSTELHTRPTPVALLVTTTQVRQSQPAWNSADENRFRSTQLRLQCSTHLEQSTSHHDWQLGRHRKHFQKETTQNVLLH